LRQFDIARVDINVLYTSFKGTGFQFEITEFEIAGFHCTCGFLQNFTT
jgi:hypothetical protein